MTQIKRGADAFGIRRADKRGYMHPSSQKQASNFRGEHATGSDFCRTLEREMGRLYLLAFLLTTSHEESERCFTMTIPGIPENKTVFKEWVGTWTRHALIKMAIRCFLRTSHAAKQTCDRWPEVQSEPGRAAALGAITRLSPFDRFVFVMSVLEHYSAKECSLLLDCTVETVIEAKTRALQTLQPPPPVLIEAERASSCLAARA